MVAVCDRSSRVRARYGSLTPMFTPPTRSAEFSLFASQRAAELDAPFSDRTKTLEPRAVGLMKASACTETKRSACTRRAFCTRLCSGMKKSPSRVSTERMLGVASIFSLSRRATDRVTFFS